MVASEQVDVADMVAGIVEAAKQGLLERSEVSALRAALDAYESFDHTDADALAHMLTASPALLQAQAH